MRCESESLVAFHEGGFAAGGNSASSRSSEKLRAILNATTAASMPSSLHEGVTAISTMSAATANSKASDSQRASVWRAATNPTINEAGRMDAMHTRNSVVAAPAQMIVITIRLRAATTEIAM